MLAAPGRAGMLAAMAGAYLVPALLGIGLGTILVLDPFLTYRWSAESGLLRILGAVPYLPSAAVALTLSFGCIFRWMWAGRDVDQLLMFLLILSVFLTGLPVFFGVLTLAAAYALIFFRGAIGERCEVVWSPVYLFILAFTAATILSMIPLGDIVGWILLASRRFVHIAFFLLLVNSIRTTPQLSRCLTFLVVAGVASAVIGIAQALLFFWKGLVLLPQTMILWDTPWGRMPRATGLFGHPNQFGGALGGVGVLMAFLGTCGAGIYGTSKRVVILGGSLLIFAAVFFSASRGSWVAITATLFLIPIIQKPSRTFRYLLGVTTGVVVAYLTGVSHALWEKVVRLNPASVDLRYYIAEVAWEAMREQPLLGVGIDNLAAYNNPFRLSAHNLFLQVGSEFGAAMMIVFLLLLMSFVSRGVAAVGTAPSREAALLLQGLLLSFGAILIHAQTDVFVYSKFFWLQLALLECAILICSRKGLAETARPIFGR